MSLTAGQIESKVYELLKNSTLKNIIGGDVYLEGTRPNDSKSEDIVISFLTGRDGDIQTGIVVVNAYIPDIDNGVNKGVKTKHTLRCRELEMALKSFADSISIFEDFKFKTDRTVQTFKEDNIQQHFVNLRLKFKRSTI